MADVRSSTLLGSTSGDPSDLRKRGQGGLFLAQGRSVAAFGATAKSATLLNHCGIGPELLSCVYDSTPARQGRLTPGTLVGRGRRRPVPWHPPPRSENSA
ncbi:hypothetical protein ACQUSR_16280 [Streptomyces sp. P1-3]|uniref:hypothetical protein n=1 Tax=Streptomyces sp. P1-3 TaxID=3421658 RepID=UPI003D35C6F7